MRFHSRLVGAFDALLLATAAFTMAALIIALIKPLPVDRFAALDATPAVTEYAQAQSMRL